MYKIQMNLPARNAIGKDFLNWLQDELIAAGEQPVLFTGTAEAFCSGINLKELAALHPEEMPAFLEAIDSIAVRLFEHPAPTVAWINGHAIAGGCVLALCCDYRIAADADFIRIGLREVMLGACFPPRIMAIMKHRLGPEHLYEIMLGAGVYGVQDALRLGMIDEVASDAEAQSQKWVERLSSYPQGTYGKTKQNLQSGVTEISPEQHRNFLENEVPIWTSPEMKKRVLALLAK